MEIIQGPSLQVIKCSLDSIYFPAGSGDLHGLSLFSLLEEVGTGVEVLTGGTCSYLLIG
jgi:hypothetical protein